MTGALHKASAGSRSRTAKTNGHAGPAEALKALQASALEYIARGFVPVPLCPRSSALTQAGLLDLRIETADVAKYFDARAGGIGLLLGAPEGPQSGLVDIDLDSPEALRLADKFLPATDYVSGRQSNPSSHRFYRVLPCPPTEKFKNPLYVKGSGEHETVVELRGTKNDGGVGYTARVFPSVHESGEQIRFDRDNGPELVNPDELRRATARLAAGALLLRNWPDADPYETRVALDGMLAGIGWQEEETADFVLAVADASRQKVRREVRDTYKRIANQKPATGGPRLAQLLGERGNTIVSTVTGWLTNKTKEDTRLLVSSIPTNEFIERVEHVLADDPEQKLFLRAQRIVRVVEENRTFKSEATFFRPKGNTYLALADADYLERALNDTGLVYKRVKTGAEVEEFEEFRAAAPAKWCRHIIGRPSTQLDHVPWRRLDAITNVPFLLNDGSLVDQSGYHAATGIWYDPRGQNFPPIPARPKLEQARAALGKFADVFSEFPFAVEKDHSWEASPAYAAVLATILGILLRHLLPTVPMLGITAPEAGSGKTKIAEAIGGATTGCLLPRISYDSTEEFDKQLPVPLAAGDQIILIDNVDRKMVTSARLSTVLSTDADVKWRVLGETREQTLLNRSVFIVTGNHLIISGDLPRRSLLCRLVPNVAAPETRAFDFDPVPRAREMFPELAMAALTAARYYLRANCPRPEYGKDVVTESGSFTEWNRVVRGMLVHLEFGDPLATQEDVRNENPMLENDIELARALREDFPYAKEFSVSSIFNKTAESKIGAIHGSKSYALLVGPNDKWDAQKVGYRLRGLRDRVLDDLKVEVTKRLHGAVYYRVTNSRKGRVG
jgi:hypothetical protein